MSGSTEGLKSVLDAINNGKSYPALSLVKNNPETAAVISKLVRGREERRFDKNKPSSYFNIDQSRMSDISHTVKERISDAENMMQLFPDLELAAQILISSILSPKDMVNTEVIYSIGENVIPAEVSMKITEIIKNHCNGYYDLKQQLPDILREELFNTGSYIKAIIPESAIDELINKGTTIATEQLTEIVGKDKKIVSLGILGPASRAEAGDSTGEPTVAVGLESFNLKKLPYQHFETGVTYATESGKREVVPEWKLEISDNYQLLKLPKLIEANNKAKLKFKIHNQRFNQVATESRQVTKGKILSERELESVIYKGSQNNSLPFVAIKTQASSKRMSVGRPLNIRLPSESVIPVHVPGDPKHHIGYFVLIDEEGNPVTRHSSAESLGNLQSSLNGQNSSMSSFLLQKAKRNLIQQDARNLNIDQAAKVYSDIVEADLIERLRNGIYGTNAEISKHEDIYRIMLARTFANQYTRLVYVPVELVTYFAYKYYDNGIGKSLLDDLKVITSLRSILMFAKVMAMTKNSIALTQVNMTIDPNDPDPQKTIEMSIHEIIKMRQQYFPLGINSPTDLVDWIQRAGFEFTFEGHPGLPQTKFDFETKNMQHTIPDSDLDELLRKQTFMALGLSPETVDAGFTAEFATTVVANNILLSKRVLQIQEQFTPQLTDFVKKIVLNDYMIRDEIIQTLKDNQAAVDKFLTQEDKTLLSENENIFFETLFMRVTELLHISLPKPDITSLENQSQAFEHYSEAIDKAIDAYVSTEFITTEVSGEISNSIDVIKGVWKAYFLRRWMADNGYMTELNDIVTMDENGKPSVDLMDMMKSHIEALMLGSVKFLDSMKTARNAADKDLEKMNLNQTGPMESSTDDTSSSGGDDFGMGDDLGLGGDDLTLDGVPPEENNPEEPPEKPEETPPEETPPVE